MLRLTIVSNALHLEAVRRIDRMAAAGRKLPGLNLLIYEPRRCQLEAGDRRHWPLRLRISPAVMAALALPALLGLVAEVRLAHLRHAGRALRWVVHRSRRITLLDDGLDQYRNQPRAIDPLRFPAGTACWLFSDAVPFRAAWCRRFDCRDLGPLYPSLPPSTDAGGREGPEPVGAEPVGAEPVAADPAARGSLIIDAPGLERLAPLVDRLPHPWLVVPHPVAAKRSWNLPLLPGDAEAGGPPEPLIARWRGLVVVGESMTLLAALSDRRSGTGLLVALPESADLNLARLVRDRMERDPSVELV